MHSHGRGIFCGRTLCGVMIGECSMMRRGAMRCGGSVMLCGGSVMLCGCRVAFLTKLGLSRGIFVGLLIRFDLKSI